MDIENLIRNPRPALEDVQRARAAYLARGLHQSGDLTVIACNHGASPAVRFGWPIAQHLTRSGRDGADLALLEAMDVDFLAARFARVTIASGDGIFADTAAKLEARGVEVTVVHPSDGLSARLKLASSHQVPFEFGSPQADSISRAAA